MDSDGNIIKTVNGRPYKVSIGEEKYHRVATEFLAAKVGDQSGMLLRDIENKIPVLRVNWVKDNGGNRIITITVDNKKVKKPLAVLKDKEGDGFYSTSNGIINCKLDEKGKMVVVEKSFDTNINSNMEGSNIPSKKGTKFIANYEGFRSKAYRGQDSGNLTIGYGHVLRPGENYDNAITQEEALILLEQDMNQSVCAVRAFLEVNDLTVNQNQFDALVSFTYNTGPGVWDMKVEKFTLKKLLINGEYTDNDINDAFTRWVKVKKADGSYINSAGLWHRRMDEAELFLYGDYAIDTSRKVPGGYR